MRMSGALDAHVTVMALAVSLLFTGFSQASRIRAHQLACRSSDPCSVRQVQRFELRAQAWNRLQLIFELNPIYVLDVLSEELSVVEDDGATDRAHPGYQHRSCGSEPLG